MKNTQDSNSKRAGIGSTTLFADLGKPTLLRALAAISTKEEILPLWEESERLRIESRDALQSLVDAIGGIDSSTWLPTEVCEAYERAKDILANAKEQ